MKKTLFVLYISLVLMSCNKKINASDISKINGYWEIEEVVFPDGNTKKYTINETYDFFKVKNNLGFRKKVTPQLDGTFLVNDAFEKIAIIEKDNKFFINYSTPFSKWKEEIHSISDENLVLINDVKNEYHYKRAAPINILDNGKKTK